MKIAQTSFSNQMSNSKIGQKEVTGFYCPANYVGHIWADSTQN